MGSPKTAKRPGIQPTVGSSLPEQWRNITSPLSPLTLTNKIDFQRNARLLLYDVLSSYSNYIANPHCTLLFLENQFLTTLLIQFATEQSHESGRGGERGNSPPPPPPPPGDFPWSIPQKTARCGIGRRYGVGCYGEDVSPLSPANRPSALSA